MSREIDDRLENNHADSDEELDIAGDPEFTQYAYAFQDFHTGAPPPENAIREGIPNIPDTSNPIPLRSRANDAANDLSRRRVDLEREIQQLRITCVELECILRRDATLYEDQVNPGPSRRRSTTRTSGIEPRHHVTSQQELMSPRENVLDRLTARSSASIRRNPSQELASRRASRHEINHPPPPPPDDQ